ncbi:MAG: ABC transporter ATP-binding protein/permease [Flavobacteriales bacterium]|jgi:subfamily B ATP-binding cassette protein MsbA|nr:ABC transporter ATP-binding protein/permease [Flavobacteriales bacterium]
MKGIGRIIAFLKPYKTFAFLNIFGNIMAVIFNMITFLIMGKVVGVLFDSNQQEPVLEEKFFPWLDQFLFELNHQFYTTFLAIDKSNALLYVAIAIVVSFFFKSFFIYFAQYFLAPIRSNLLRDLRKSLHDKILKLPVSFFSEKRKGDMLTRVTNDVIEVEASVISVLELLIRDPFTILSSIVVMLIISWKLTIFVFIFLPLAGSIISLVGKKLKQHSDAGQKQVSVLLSMLEENLSGLKIIKAFGVESYSTKTYDVENEKFTLINNKIRRRQDMASPMSEFLGAIVISTVFWYGGNLIFSNDPTALKPEMFISYILFFWQLLAPIKNISRAYMNLKKGMVSADRIFEILDTEEETDPDKKYLPYQQFDSGISLNNLHFSYKEGTPVLKNINLEIKKGETVALVGQSGSGKSTLADLIARFYPVTDGSILFDGKDLNDLNILDVRGKMSIISQESILFNDSIAENIRFGKEHITKESIEEAAKIANADEFISKMEHGYDTNIGDQGSKLSGGQKQRISIARAVLANPDILIMDEATSALDTESEKLVQEAINKLLTNRTSIIIAHRLSTIIHADKIVVMHEGKIVEQGTHAELLELNGYYTKLHQMQDIAT